MFIIKFKKKTDTNTKGYIFTPCSQMFWKCNNLKEVYAIKYENIFIHPHSSDENSRTGLIKEAPLYLYNLVTI